MGYCTKGKEMRWDNSEEEKLKEKRTIGEGRREQQAPEAWSLVKKYRNLQVQWENILTL